MIKEEATQLLKTWNNGIYRGAQRRLARELKVEESAIANCLSGRQNPSEKMLVKMARIFNRPEDEIKRIFCTPKDEMAYVQNNIKSKGPFNQIINEYKVESFENRLKVLESKIDSLSSKIELIAEIIKGGK